MKKTMFITSVIMVVVLAIALTTSSLAWFNAGGSTQVRTTDISITAATATTSSGLQISGDPNTESSWKSGTRVAVVGNETRANNKPAAIVGNKAGTQMTHEELYNAIVKNAQSGAIGLKGNLTFKPDDADEQFKGTAYEVTPYKGEIWCRNSGYTAGNVTCTISNIAITQVTGETGNHNALVWVAVFDVTSGTPVLVALKGSESEYSNIAWSVDGSELADQQPVSGVGNLNVASWAQLVAPTTTLFAGGSDQYNETSQEYHFVAGAAHHYEIYSWFDGKNLNNQNTDTLATFDISFEIADVVNP